MDLQDIAAKLDLLLERQQRLVDRQAILDCVTAYSRGIDRVDDEITLSVYHRDGIDDHGAHVGDGPAFAAWANAGHLQMGGTQHYVTNHTCELTGDVAHTETYWYAVIKDPDGEGVNMSGGRYIDRLERRDGAWRIAARKCTVEWGGQPAMTPLAPEVRATYNSGAQAARNRSDVSYERPLTIDPARLAAFAAR